MSILKQIFELKTKPFYSKGTLDEQDKKDQTLYYQCEKKLKENAKKLKKGEKVLFNFPIKVKHNRKGEFFNFDLKDNLLEGKVYKPFYIKKRMRMGEDCSVETIKVEAGNMIYEVSPDEVEKIK